MCHISPVALYTAGHSAQPDTGRGPQPEQRCWSNKPRTSHRGSGPAPGSHRFPEGQPIFSALPAFLPQLEKGDNPPPSLSSKKTKEQSGQTEISDSEPRYRLSWNGEL